MANPKKTTAKKIRVTQTDIERVRKSKTVDTSPNWAGCEDWDTARFQKFFWDAMSYYRLEFTPKDLKPKVIEWMERNDYPKAEIQAFRKTSDWRCHLTMGALASCLLRGMPDVREDFNHGRSNVSALKRYIVEVTSVGRLDVDSTEPKDEKPAKETKVEEPKAPNIQERIREIANNHIGHFDDIQDQNRTRKVLPKAYDYLTEKKVPAAMLGRIREVFQQRLDEWRAAQDGSDEQLKEGYSHWARADFKKYIEFATSILTDIDSYSQAARTAKKARIKKAPSKEKLIARLKFCKDFAPLKLVSINPADIIGAQQLWVYNTKTRKLGCYVAEDLGGSLSVKGTAVVGFKESDSVQKTVRKPEVVLEEFKRAGKLQLRKFMDTIKTTEIKLTGRINEDVVLLRVL